MVTEENMARVFEVFDRLGKVFASLESFAGDINLSKLELLALDFISKEGELIMSTLGKGLGISLSTATGIIDRLIEKKLVKRERNHGDRRIVRVALTEKGKRTALAYEKHKKEAIKKMMDILTVEEQKNFISTWDKIVNNWE